MKIPDMLKRNAFFLIFVSAFIFYGISAGIKITEQSKTPQYVYLAYSFLHGKTYMVELPKSTFDMIRFEDRWYVAGGITPALLLMPFVLIFGTTFSDVLFGVGVGALNVALMYSLLSSLVEKTSTRLWLILLFAAGTAHWALSSVGSVWLNAQITALLFMILYVRETLKDRPWLAGLCLGLAFLSRPPTLFSAAFYLAYVLLQERAFQPALKKLIPFGIMVLASIAVMFTYNYLRFGNPTDFGYINVSGTKALTNTYAKTGGFNIRYMPCNMYVSLLGMPNIDLHPLPAVNEVCYYLEPVMHDFGKASKFFNPLGMSIFLVTPALFLIFRARIKNDDLVLPAWIGIISVFIPLWMYHTTGWVQFGYRYITDLIVFFFILLSRAIKQTGYLEKALILSSVMMGATGFYLTYYSTFGMLWHEMFMEMARKIYHFAF
jgi:hypothetical protein